MIEFGKTLVAAREAKGYTIAQVAEITHLASSTITDLENENFSRIAAPIYGRGFVKLYCETVGLDPKPMVAEFMEIYSGNRDTNIREREISASSAIPPASDPAFAKPAAEIPLAEPPADAPLAESPIIESPVNESFAEPPAAETEADPSLEPLAPAQPVQASFFDEPAIRTAASPVARPLAADPQLTPVASELDASDARLSRYSTPLQRTRVNHFSPAYWRIAILAAVALLLLWGIIIGIRALYRATDSSAPTTTETPVSTETAAAPVADKTPTPAKAAPVKRDPVPVPALYLD